MDHPKNSDLYIISLPRLTTEAQTLPKLLEVHSKRETAQGCSNKKYCLAIALARTALPHEKARLLELSVQTYLNFA